MSVDSADEPRSGYRAVSPWRPWAAATASLLLVAASIAASIATAALLAGFGRGQIAEYDRPAAWAAMAAFQAVAALGAWWLSGWFGGDRTAVLALDRRAAEPARLAAYFLMLALPSLAYTYLIFWWRPDIVHADMATFSPLVHARTWPIYLAIIAIGAPLSEELVFRGFLQSALARTRIGFIGASVLTTTAWAMLHIQYSIWGLAEIVVVGLFLSWTLWRTGSLWTPILLHGLYNAAQFAGLMLRLFPWS